MSDDKGNGGAAPTDDRTLLDPLDAEELRALREARQKLKAHGSSRPSKNPIGPDAGQPDIGDAPTRAVMQMPAFDSKTPAPSITAKDDPTPIETRLPSMPKNGEREPATVIAKEGSSPKVEVKLAKTEPEAKPVSKSEKSEPSSKPASSKQPGFGENTLLWMQPVKAREQEVIPERGAAAAAGMTPTHIHDTKARRVAGFVLGALGIVLAVVIGVVLFGGGGEPSVIELVTEPSGATVLINGNPAEIKTPMKARLKPGDYEIEVRLPTHQTERLDVKVLSGAQPDRRTLYLHPISQPGLMTVSVEVEPVAANISIDGKTYPSRKVLRAANIDPVSAHTITVETGGYGRIERNVPAGQLEERYAFRLTPAE